ncbi:MAG: LemA/RetS hybrid sensor kinaseresponse regulator protein, partial [Deltaproteobacteria bacterium]|nr:LemA/RetS hybrid sensor kinaseresponse regulator protein [Deltaproteobacteria bacterium]
MAYLPLAVLVIVLTWFVAAYNKLVRLRNQIKNAWHQIDVQLKRRHDLIPNLVEVVKDYMSYEQETLTKVIEARGAAVSAKGTAAQAKAENVLTESLKSLFAVVENYPDLKANQNVAALQEELRADRDREQDLLRAPVLQRLRDDVQQHDPGDPQQHRRLPVQLRPGDVLPGGGDGPGGPQGRPAVTVPRFPSGNAARSAKMALRLRGCPRAEASISVGLPARLGTRASLPVVDFAHSRGRSHARVSLLIRRQGLRRKRDVPDGQGWPSAAEATDGRERPAQGTPSAACAPSMRSGTRCLWSTVLADNYGRKGRPERRGTRA